MPSFKVSRASQHELMPALRLLLGPIEDQELRAEQSLGTFTSGDYDADGLFVARDPGGRVIGAALVQILPGALGVAWPPRGDSDEIEDALTQAACTWLRESGVKVCQAFAASPDHTEMAPLERNGFRHVTQLVSMRRDVDLKGGWGDAPHLPLKCYRAVTGPTRVQIDTLLATHEATLDCPELNGLRSTEEILAGYFPGNESSNTWWLTDGEEDKAVGVLLLDKGAEPSVLELSYIGLIPELRGRGYGGSALEQVNRIAGSAGYLFVSVTVDGRNDPALRLYRRYGFVETDRRDVFLAVWEVKVERGVLKVKSAE